MQNYRQTKDSIVYYIVIVIVYSNNKITKVVLPP